VTKSISPLVVREDFYTDRDFHDLSICGQLVSIVVSLTNWEQLVQRFLGRVC
jgi:hypothetical protein